LQPVNLGILITGPGTIMNSILSAWSEGRIKNITPRIVISTSGSNASILNEVSKKYGIKTTIVEYSGTKIRDESLPDEIFSDNDEMKWISSQGIQEEMEIRWKSHDKEIYELLCENSVTPENGLVCLAEYRLLISNRLVNLYHNKMMNIHPSLLPSFPGWKDVLKNTLERGVKVTGVTVHFVTNILDSGPIIAQIPVPIFDGDDPTALRKRLLDEACKLYPYCINLFATGKLHGKIEGQRVQCSCWSEACKSDNSLWSFVNHLK
jgi:folate-dependent phosphoribosylglycinamide formyltransferase PurN